jgi:hypothetical protein
MDFSAAVGAREHNNLIEKFAGNLLNRDQQGL